MTISNVSCESIAQMNHVTHELSSSGGKGYRCVFLSKIALCFFAGGYAYARIMISSIVNLLVALTA